MERVRRAVAIEIENSPPGFYAVVEQYRALWRRSRRWPGPPP
jgi:hypothetical protein